MPTSILLIYKRLTLEVENPEGGRSDIVGSVRGSHIINYNVSSALLLGRGWQPLSSTNNSLYILCFRLFANHDILLMGQVLHSKQTALAVSFDVFYHLPLNL